MKKHDIRIEKHLVFLFFLIFQLVSSVGLFAETNGGVRTSLSNTNGAYLADLYGDTTNIQKPKTVKTGSSFFGVLKVLFLTALFGFLAYLVVRFVVKQSGLPTTEDQKFVEIIANHAVGLGNYIEIVQVAGQYYLLSISSDGVRLIDKITDKEQIDTIEFNKEALKPKSTRFFDLIPNLPKHLKKDKLAFLKSQKDRLKKM